MVPMFSASDYLYFSKPHPHMRAWGLPGCFSASHSQIGVTKEICVSSADSGHTIYLGTQPSHCHCFPRLSSAALAQTHTLVTFNAIDWQIDLLLSICKHLSAVFLAADDDCGEVLPKKLLREITRRIGANLRELGILAPKISLSTVAECLNDRGPSLESLSLGVRVGDGDFGSWESVFDQCRQLKSLQIVSLEAVAPMLTNGREWFASYLAALGTAIHTCDLPLLERIIIHAESWLRVTPTDFLRAALAGSRRTLTTLGLSQFVIDDAAAKVIVRLMRQSGELSLVLRNCRFECSDTLNQILHNDVHLSQLVLSGSKCSRQQDAIDGSRSLSQEANHGGVRWLDLNHVELFDRSILQALASVGTNTTYLDLGNIPCSETVLGEISASLARVVQLRHLNLSRLPCKHLLPKMQSQECKAKFVNVRGDTLDAASLRELCRVFPLGVEILVTNTLCSDSPTWCDALRSLNVECLCLQEPPIAVDRIVDASVRQININHYVQTEMILSLKACFPNLQYVVGMNEAASVVVDNVQFVSLDYLINSNPSHLIDVLNVCCP